MVVQARPCLAEILRKFAVAGREHKDFVSFLDRAFYVITALIRTDILRSVVGLLQDVRDFSPIALAYTDIAVALVVLQKNIVLRRVLFDKTTFKDERFKLAVGDNVLEVIDVVDHTANLFGMVVL